MTTTEQPETGVPHEVRRSLLASLMQTVTADAAMAGTPGQMWEPGDVRVVLRGVTPDGKPAAWSIDPDTASGLLAQLAETVVEVHQLRESMT